MQAFDLSQQIAFVRRTGESSKTVIGAIISGAVSATSIIFFNLLTDQNVKVILLFIACVSALLAAAVLLAYPRFKRAARAIRVGRRVNGVLQLEVNDIDTEDMTIFGVVMAASGTLRMKFDKPFGWIPENGEWPCELIFLDDERMPVLVQLNEGLLFPTRITG